MTDWNCGGVARNAVLTLREGGRTERGMGGAEIEHQDGGGTKFMVRVFGSVKVLPAWNG